MVPKAWFFSSLLMVTLLVGGCSSASFVDEITFLNETEYPAHVEVSGASRRGWLNLAMAQPDEKTIVREVIDQGDVWVLRFDYAGHEEELEVKRTDLIRADWIVEVPESFGDALQRLGVEPPP